jgi:N-acetylglucosaminyldiphosphoundecaprenol N-acetyl-beta-D-mannosaminyltransferase
MALPPLLLNYVLGVPTLVGDVDHAADVLTDRAKRGKGGYACLCNVHTLMLAQTDEALRTALLEAAVVLPDGAPVAWLQRRHGYTDAARVAGADLMAAVIERGERHGLRHFFFGSTQPVLVGLLSALEARHPGVKITGTASPAFQEAAEIVPPAAVGSAHFVWCGLGAPKQELWMKTWAETLAPAVVVGVGAAFEFLAGTKERAPLWMQRHGLEWLHRLAHDPRRLAKRYITTNSRFAVSAAVDLTRRLAL